MYLLSSFDLLSNMDMCTFIYNIYLYSSCQWCKEIKFESKLVKNKQEHKHFFNYCLDVNILIVCRFTNIDLYRLKCSFCVSDVKH